MSANYESLIRGISPSITRKPTPESVLQRGAPVCDEEPTVRARLAAQLSTVKGQVKGGGTGRALLKLRTGNRSERISAARELGDVALAEGRRVPEAVVPLCVALKSDADPAVRQEAAWSLWKLSDDRAHRPLMAALVGDKSSRVREKAARALGLMGVEDAAPIMMDLLSLGKHIPGRLRAALAASLGFIAEEEALPLLIEAADDPEPAVRQEAVQSLGRYLVDFDGSVTDRAFSRLSRFVQARTESCPAIRQAAIKALRMSPQGRANEAVARAAVADTDPAVRELAAETLLLWNSAASEAALVEMLSDDVWSVRKSAARSLARFVRRHGVHSSASACEALYRMTRMFPSASQERKLAEEAISSLDPSRESSRRRADSRAC